MLGVTKLLFEANEISKRIGRSSPEKRGLCPDPGLLQFAAEKHPVVVWNITKRCNLKCVFQLY